MKKELIETELHRSFQNEVDSIWSPVGRVDILVPQLREQVHHKWRIGSIPKTPITWVLIPLVTLLIGGTVYGATSLVRAYINSLAPDIESRGLLTSLNLSETVRGVTVNIEQGYADSNTILLGYTISGQKGRYYTSDQKLSIPGGLVLDSVAGLGYIPSTDILGWNPPETTIVTAFDATSIQGTPSEIRLRFEICFSDTPTDDQSQLWGPFVFDFTLPFRAGKYVVLEQTTDVANIRITLEKVLISPAGTSAVFNISPEYESIRDRPLLVTSLRPSEALQNGTVSEGISESSCTQRESDSLTYYRGDFTNRTGQWTLTVNELVFIPRHPAGVTGDYEGKASDVTRISGPWIFQFEVK